MKVEDILGGSGHRRYRRGPRQNRINGLSLSPVELRAEEERDCECGDNCECPPVQNTETPNEY